MESLSRSRSGQRPSAAHVICNCVHKSDRTHLFCSPVQELPQTLGTTVRIDQLRRRPSFFVDLFRLVGGHSLAPLLDRFAVGWSNLLGIPARAALPERSKNLALAFVHLVDVLQ